MSISQVYDERMEEILVKFTDEEYKKLVETARVWERSIEELVHERVVGTLPAKDEVPRAELKKRLLSLKGKFRDREGATDVGVNHDKYLADIYAEKIRR